MDVPFSPICSTVHLACREHRRWALEASLGGLGAGGEGKQDPAGGRDDDLRLCAAMIEKDAKNYHAWQHRQWLAEKFGWAI